MASAKEILTPGMRLVVSGTVLGNRAYVNKAGQPVVSLSVKWDGGRYDFTVPATDRYFAGLVAGEPVVMFGDMYQHPRFGWQEPREWSLVAADVAPAADAGKKGGAA